MNNNDVAVSTVNYVVSNDLVKASSLLPSNKNRSLLVHSLVKSYGLLSDGTCATSRTIKLIRPTPATFKDLSAYHTGDYLQFVLNSGKADNSDPDEYGLEEDCPIFEGLPEYVRLVAGASLSAANSLHQTEADIAICWDGGRHHAHKSHASGFCYVADCVLALLALKRSRNSALTHPPKPRIMYLDLDLHFSDAVSQAFSSASASAPQVLTFSLHHAERGFFPASPLSALPDVSAPHFDPFTLALPLARGASDATFAAVWSVVERVRDAYCPDYVVVQCGVDGLAGDPHAVWNWSLGGGAGSLGWCIDRICNQWSGKKLLLGGGGYHSANAARAWTYLTSIAMGQPLALDADIPDHPAFPLYAPSFTLDVPPGNAQDDNTEEYLRQVATCFDDVIAAIKQRVA